MFYSDFIIFKHFYATRVHFPAGCLYKVIVSEIQPYIYLYQINTKACGIAHHHHLHLCVIRCLCALPPCHRTIVLFSPSHLFQMVWKTVSKCNPVLCNANWLFQIENVCVLQESHIYNLYCITSWLLWCIFGLSVNLYKVMMLLWRHFSVKAALSKWAWCDDVSLDHMHRKKYASPALFPLLLTPDLLLKI